MKLGIVTGGYTHFFIRDLVELVDYFADLGYTAFDLSLDSAYDRELLMDENHMLAKRLLAKLKQRGLLITQAHAPGQGYLEDDMSKLDDLLIRSIKACNYLGVKSLVVHMLHIKGSDEDTFISENIKYYSKFLDLLDEYNVDFCFENLGTNIEKDMYCNTADRLLKLINGMNHKHIHACWDTGHGNLTRQDQYESITKLGDHLRAIHVHDNLYPIAEKDGIFTPDCHNFPLFGNVNFDAVIQALIDIDYRGAFSIETDTPNRRGHKDFVYNGETQLLLKPIPFWIREKSDELLFEIGKYMLETYNVYEE